MNKTILIGFNFLSGFLLASSLILPSTKPAAAALEFPITSLRILPPIKTGEIRALMIVPDKELSQSAFGSELRLYDIRMAKMFEVSHTYCGELGSQWKSVEWHLFAGNGETNVGKFVIGCQLVRDIAGAYGFGQREPTEVAYELGNSTSTQYMPVLNIVGGKVSRFVNFSRQFRPVENAQRIDRR